MNTICSECELGNITCKQCITGAGNPKAPVMIVGTAPSIRQNFWDYQPLAETLENCGFSQNDIYYTHLVKCSARDQEGNKKKILDPYAKVCIQKLKDEVRKVNPKVVILLGSITSSLYERVTGQFIGSLGFMNQSQSSTILGIPLFKVLSPYHSTDAARSFYKSEALNKQLKDINTNILKISLKYDVLNYRTVNSASSRKALLDWLRENDTFTFDIESSCGDSDIYLDTRANPSTIYLLGIGNDTIQWVVIVDRVIDGVWSSQEEEELFFKELFEIAKGKFGIGQGAKFDNKFLQYTKGGQLPLCFDTMLASHLLDENNPHGLKDLATRFFDAPDYDIPKPIDFTKVSVDDVIKYNALDIYYTHKLYLKFNEELQKDTKLNRLFYNVTMPSSIALGKVEQLGVYLDMEAFSEAKVYFSREISDYKRQLTDFADINWNSTQQVAKVLYTDRGIEPPMLTAGGKPSTSETALKIFNDPIGNLILEYRSSVKMLQFLVSWDDWLDSDNRMHPRYLIHGTDTGRLSCRDPNLQQVPRNSMVRSCISAPKGWILGEVDYSQIELRLAAELSGDQAMLMAFATGQDVHKLTASRVLGVDPEAVSKDDRKKAKAVNFGFLYGMGAKKFQEYARDKYEVNISLEEAKQFRKRFFALYSRLPSWHQRQINLADQFGLVRNKLGRIRHLAPDIYSSDKMIASGAERKSINSPVQSLASDITQFNLARITREIPEDKLRVVGTVHDAILFEVREDSTHLCSKVNSMLTNMDLIEETFSTKFTVPIEVEIKLGPWGKGKVYIPE